MCDHSHHATRYRHRWEMPMIWLSCAITIIALLFAGLVFWADSQGELAEFGEDANELRDMAKSALLILIAPVLIYIYRFYMAASVKANAVRVGPNQFPELFAIYQDIGARLGMQRLPRFYVVNGNGTVNAYALECNRRHRYVVMHSEIALLYKTSPDVVEFVLAHELAHHRLRHVSLWRIVVGLVPNLLVLPGQATTRAQEYSADRLAISVCPNHANAMRLLSVGPWMEKGVNPEAWLEQCEEERGEFMVRVANAMSSHAVMVKRFKALKDIERHGFTHHGDMF